jgi:hypothetical protein
MIGRLGGYAPGMQLTLTTSAVLTTLLAPQAAAAAAPPSTVHPVADTSPAALPPTSPCPAYFGPQCDSVEHEQIATGQDIAALGPGLAE